MFNIFTNVEWVIYLTVIVVAWLSVEAYKERTEAYKDRTSLFEDAFSDFLEVYIDISGNSAPVKTKGAAMREDLKEQ